MGVCANLVLIAIILIKRPLRRFDGEYYLLKPQQTEYIITSPKSHLNNISGGARVWSFTRLWWTVPGKILPFSPHLPWLMLPPNLITVLMVMPVVAGPPYYCRWADPSSCARPSASAPWWRPPSSSSSPCPPWTSWPPSSTTPPSSPTRTQRTRSHSSKTVLNVSPLDYLWYGISDKWTCASLCSIFKLERELFATSLFINYNYVIKEALKQHLFWYKMIFWHCILTNSASKILGFVTFV